MLRIHVFGDRQSLLTACRASLGRLGHATYTPPDLLSFLEAVYAAQPDLVVIDLVAYPPRGEQACRELSIDPRLMGVPKVLVVSDDQLSTLDPALGFDDFVVEPFAPEALLARFRLLRHRQAHGPRGGLLTHGPLRLDLAAYRADLANEPLDLTPLEFELLCFLAAHPGIVYSREKLLSMVWPEGTQAGTRTIDVHVRRLRAKLGDDHDSLIQTVHGVGYRFVELDDRRY